MHNFNQIWLIPLMLLGLLSFLFAHEDADCLVLVFFGSGISYGSFWMARISDRTKLALGYLWLDHFCCIHGGAQADAQPNAAMPCSCSYRKSNGDWQPIALVLLGQHWSIFC